MITGSRTLVSAYQALAIMAIDGVELKYAYNNLSSSNVSTSLEPSTHVPGEEVTFVFVGGETVEQGRYNRRVLNMCCDDMFDDLASQRSHAKHDSWGFQVD